MLGNFAFTLYEIFGYLLPGGISLFAFITLYWTLFGATRPLAIGSFEPSALTWAAIVLGCYVLGHAMQTVGNAWFGKVESSVLDIEKGKAPAWLREQARQTAVAIVKATSQQHFEPRWLFRILDEYALQNGKPGDREMFVYREGFYRGTSLSLFFLSGALLVRMIVPGTSLLLKGGLLHVSFLELLVTLGSLVLIACLFLARYRRFAEYRITRAILSAIVAQSGRGTDTLPHNT